MQAIGFTGVFASAAKIAFRCRGPNQKESYMKKPRRAVAVRRAPNRTGRRQRRVWEAWSIQAPHPKPECSANKDCPQAFHALRAAENEKQPNDPKTQKSGMPSEFIIRSGRIGPGAALKRQNPHEPSTTRFHPNFDDLEIQLLG